MSRRARRGQDKKRRKNKEKERLVRWRIVSGREDGKGGGKGGSWEGQGRAITQRCGVSEERKWKEMERGKEDRGKGRRLRQVSSSEVSEMRGVNVFIDTIVL